MPGRTFTASASNYRYGFNGKENDNEVKGVGNQQDYGMRVYDPRVGRFLSVDPITSEYPDLTPYQFSSNRPVDGIDIDGLEYINNFKAQQAKYAGALMFKMQQPKSPASVVKAIPPADIERHANHVEYTNFNVGKFLFKPAWSYKYLQYNFFNDAHIVYTSFRDGGRNATDLDYNRTTEKQRVNSFINLSMALMSGVEMTAELKAGQEFVAAGGKTNVVLSKGERLNIFQNQLKNAKPAANQEEAINLINNTLDMVEDVFSGVKKQIGIPTGDDGRMYGILDMKYVSTLEDGTMIAKTKGQRIVLNKDGGFEIQSRDGTKTYFKKEGAKQQ